MEEVLKTHLPVLAWRQQDGKIELIYDDLPVGELILGSGGQGAARYHEQRWRMERAPGGVSQMREQGSGQVLGRLRLVGKKGEADEGDLVLEDREYRVLRDPHKLPPQMSISGAAGQPLLQFRREDEAHGRIQIDSLRAASSPDFERLVLWGLYLYVAPEAAAAIETPVRQRKAPARRESNGGPAKRRRSPASARRSEGQQPGSTPPPPPTDEKGYGGWGPWEKRIVWALAILSAMMLWNASRSAKQIVPSE